MVSQIKEVLSLTDLILHTSPLWNSTAPDHRALLRQDLHVHFHNEQLLNLNIVPQLNNGAVSISHCQLLGGWAASSTAPRIGFDLELIERIRLPLAQRVCTAQEIQTAPSLGALWTAKEAAFKYLKGAGQPKVLSELSISAWRPTPTKDLHLFTATFGGQIFQGCSWPVSDFIWASLC